MTHVKELIRVIGDRQVFIQTHNFPDPDAIASAYGLQYILKQKGIRARICYDGNINNLSAERLMRLFSIEMEAVETIRDMSPSDLIILVDSQIHNSNVTELTGETLACIDHHPVVEEADYAYRDLRKVGACASMIAEYLFEEGLTPDTSVATCLLYGIKIDTKNFVRGVEETDVKMYDALFPYVDRYLLSRMCINQLTMEDLKAYGEAISDVTVSSFLGFTMLKSECTNALVAIVSDFILTLDVVEVSVACAPQGSGIRVSVRSETAAVDSGKLMREALRGIGRGGGHAVMAGGFIPHEGILALISETACDLVDKRCLRCVREALEKRFMAVCQEMLSDQA